jgi:hypothetical protein
VPVRPIARSLANLESIIGQLYLALTIASLVTLERQTGAADRQVAPRQNFTEVQHIAFAADLLDFADSQPTG